ncbi:MAG: cupin domain-containing protein [Gammaproteobacteria bacterium]
MSLPQMQKANIDKAPTDVHGDISKQVVSLDDVTAIKVTFDAGAKWSKDLKAYAGTESCLLPHVAYVISGKIHIVMDDGSEETFEKGDIMMLPPGHDAWTVGDEPCVFIQFTNGDNYYNDRVANT